MKLELGKIYSKEAIDGIRIREDIRSYSFSIDLSNNYRIRFNNKMFVSIDRGENYTLVEKDGNKYELKGLRTDSQVTYITSDYRNTRDYYTRYNDKSGGKPGFNPVTGTGGPNGKKTLD